MAISISPRRSFSFSRRDSPPRFDTTIFRLGQPILLIPGLSLKFPYLVFGCAELSRHLVSRFYGLPVFCLRSTGGSVKGAQNSLPGLVKQVASFGPSVRFGCLLPLPWLHRHWHSSIQNTEANFQHPVGPQTIRPPVDNSLLLSVWLASHPA
jgi:hypothetical protein